MKLYFLYRVYDVHNRLLYIGRTYNPEQRIANHGRAEWRRFAARIDWEPVGPLELATAAERAAIRDEDPIYNKHHGSRPNKPAGSSEPYTAEEWRLVRDERRVAS